MSEVLSIKAPLKSSPANYTLSDRFIEGQRAAGSGLTLQFRRRGNGTGETIRTALPALACNGLLGVTRQDCSRLLECHQM
jgi:hypothetical protein